MWTLRTPGIHLLTLFALVASGLLTPTRSSWADTVERAQLEPSASILLRDVAAEVCANPSRASADALASLSPPRRRRLEDAGAVFRSMGYGQPTASADLAQQLSGLPAGPACRAQVLSKLWQYFTSSGRQDGDAGHGAATESVAVASVDSIPRLPGLENGPSMASPGSPTAPLAPAVPAARPLAPNSAVGAASGLTPATPVASPRDELSISTPDEGRGSTLAASTKPGANLPEASASSSLGAGPPSSGSIAVAAADTALAKPGAGSPPESSMSSAPGTQDVVTRSPRSWNWNWALLVAGVTALAAAAMARLGGWRARRKTSAQLARDRLRPI
jgi:hypothetical protein